MTSRSIASALSILTGKTFGFTVLDSPDNTNLEAFVQEYFTRNDEITDCESSNSKVEGIQKWSWCVTIEVHLVGEESVATQEEENFDGD